MLFHPNIFGFVRAARCLMIIFYLYLRSWDLVVPHGPHGFVFFSESGWVSYCNTLPDNTHIYIYIYIISIYIYIYTLYLIYIHTMFRSEMAMERDMRWELATWWYPIGIGPAWKMAKLLSRLEPGWSHGAMATEGIWRRSWWRSSS